MSLSGSLRTMDLAELLQWVALGRKTGSLAFIRGKTRNCIYFQEGRIISSSSDEPAKQLGHFLLFQGKLGEPELKRALEVQRQSRNLLGKILVDLGYVSEEEVERALVARTEEVIYDLFLWDEGYFQFTNEGLPLDQLIQIGLDINAILFEGVRRKDEWARIREVFPDNSVVLSLRPGADVRGMELTALQKKLLYLITREKSVAEMILEVHGSDFLVNYDLFQLHDQGILQLKAAPGAPKVEDQAARFFRQGLELMQKGSFREAVDAFREVRRVDPTIPGIDEQIEAGERAICEEICRRSVPAYTIPFFLVPETSLVHHKLNHEEAFVASRINGSSDVRTIVMLTPLREVDILQSLEKLHQLGLIGLK